jgi:hypothetical protein
MSRSATSITIPEAILQVADQTLHSEDRMVIKAYGFIPVTEYFMRDFVKKLMHKYERPELSTPIAMIIKELTVNATKANFKRIVFNENKVNMSDPVDYERGMKIFRAAISDRMSLEYGRKAKLARLNIHATFDFDRDRVIIEIRNNLGMTRSEEARVRAKLREAMRCSDVAEFMMENIDETEGAGLGLVLSLMALKSSGIDPHMLTIQTDYETHTRARVEIPLHDNYLPRRHRFQKQRLLA